MISSALPPVDTFEATVRARPSGSIAVRAHHLRSTRPTVAPVQPKEPRPCVERRKRLLVHPYAGEGEAIDLADTLVSAIAHKLWELYDGDEKLNWLEAEMLLHDVLRQYHGLWTQQPSDAAASTGTRPSD